MAQSLNQYQHIFFIGVAGAGMSAIAQYLAGIGKEVSGSDRFFMDGQPNETRDKLQAEGINCFVQNGDGITDKTQLVVVSTAIEETVAEVQKARALHIPILKRSQVLALIAQTKRTIAVAGTSGKSTTSAMLFHILEHAGLQPSIISGAGLTSIIKEGKIGNAKVGAGEWLVIEADESDGSIIEYKPEMGLLLNIEKDHQEIDELLRIFNIFKQNTTGKFIVNQSNLLACKLSQNSKNDFSVNGSAGVNAVNFKQDGFSVSFEINTEKFSLQAIGMHSMENAVAATAAALQIGVKLQTASEALKSYEGIYRRHQVLGNKNGIWVIDDYAHNPAKCAASILACQPFAKKLIAWFQPHGFGPTRFLKNDFIKEIAHALREQDEIWMSEIFYAGGAAVKDISANDLIQGINALGKNAFFVEDRNHFLEAVRPHLSNGAVLLLMGARDPGLEKFSQDIFVQL